VAPEHISRLRSRLKLSRAALARFLGVTEMTIIRWESGEQSSPHGLQLLLLQSLERARERADDETLGRLVNEAAVAPGPAIQRLLTLAHPPESLTTRRTQRREK
jgi:transcriptional regulator with XRE-family HTH domain